MNKLLQLLVLLTFLFISANLQGADKKKVLILDFTNIDKKADYAYLEGSITTAIKKMLKKTLVFQETDPFVWQQIAKKNYLFKKDYFTQSVATNIGLLSQQDVVIAGGFRIIESDGVSKISTQVYIIDINKKKLVSDFTLNGEVGNAVFASIAKLARRIEKEARAVLPNMEEWKQQKSKNIGESKPLFDNVSFGIRGGAFLYYKGYETYFKPEQPVLGFFFKANMPYFWDKLALQMGVYYMKHILKDGKSSQVQVLDLQGITSNYFFTGFFMVDFNLSSSLLLSPKIGGGYAYQSTAVTGEQNDTLVNYFPIVGGGFEIEYRLNKILSLVLDTQVLVELEDTNTYVGNMNVGVNFRL